MKIIKIKNNPECQIRTEDEFDALLNRELNF